MTIEENIIKVTADNCWNNQDYKKALELYSHLAIEFPDTNYYKDMVEIVKKKIEFTKKRTAILLYKPPFRYQYGYIYDADNKVVADNNLTNDGEVENENGNLLLRVRGWGHIQKIKGEHSPEDIQDEIGRLIAEGLTKFWEEEKKKHV